MTIDVWGFFCGFFCAIYWIQSLFFEGNPQPLERWQEEQVAKIGAVPAPLMAQPASALEQSHSKRELSFPFFCFAVRIQAALHMSQTVIKILNLGGDKTPPPPHTKHITLFVAEVVHAWGGNLRVTLAFVYLLQYEQPMYYFPIYFVSKVTACLKCVCRCTRIWLRLQEVAIFTYPDTRAPLFFSTPWGLH